ncbi:hypothetical protein Pla123a_44630 [Posidoniimonas polymericola]|uniref:Uncharacterized protein n=1 Tax=Posidoniimonas polymericola TaxID=2528002 RepID=A0A5C5XXE8_9BACT|nr:hypothetical protein [Posidoniimonas polymericola]TWT67033.1 hypothetical protein Pla123a_44630 [Posidoniimonas polymericola]
MTGKSRRKMDYLRLSALAADMGQLLTERQDLLSEDDAHLLFDLRSQLRGMSALLVQDDLHAAVNTIIHLAMHEYVRIKLELGPREP